MEFVDRKNGIICKAGRIVPLDRKKRIKAKLTYLENRVREIEAMIEAGTVKFKATDTTARVRRLIQNAGGMSWRQLEDEITGLEDQARKEQLRQAMNEMRGR